MMHAFQLEWKQWREVCVKAKPFARERCAWHHQDSLVLVATAGIK